MYGDIISVSGPQSLSVSRSSSIHGISLFYCIYGMVKYIYIYFSTTISV